MCQPVPRAVGLTREEHCGNRQAQLGTQAALAPCGYESPEAEMRQGLNERGLRASVLLAAICLAAVGCESGGADGDGKEPAGPMHEPGGPSGPSGPSTDPMKIGQTDLPKPPEKVEVSGLDGAEFPKAAATSFETAKDLQESSSGPSRGGVTTGGFVGATPPAAAAPSASAGAPAGGIPQGDSGAKA